MLDTEYFNTIIDKCFLNVNNNDTNKDSINTNKKDKENDYVPKISEYNLILNNSHNVN